MKDREATELPEVFCWTRFGTEAGEPIERILERKELERQANCGVFFWGVGTSVAPAVSELVQRCVRPEVLFSPIKSRPRREDAEPSSVLAWRACETLLGERLALPPTVFVTSQGNVSAPPQHYALVCSSDRPLLLSDLGQLQFNALRNLLRGTPLGVSQVTAIVRRGGDSINGDLQYRVMLRARLVWPYFVRLREPTALASVSFAPASSRPW